MDVRAKMMASGTGALALRTRRLFLWAVGAGAFVMVASTPHLVAAADLLHFTTDGNASSACIGDSRTPRCALDTWEACFIWAEPSLCEKVGVPGMGFRTRTGERSLEPSLFVFSYHVDAVLDIEARHLTRLPSDQSWFRPGYVDLRYSVQICDIPSYDRCTTFDGGNALIFKPVGPEWHVSGWLIDAGDVTCENYNWARDLPPWDHHCRLNISTREFVRYERSRALAE